MAYRITENQVFERGASAPSLATLRRLWGRSNGAISATIVPGKRQIVMFMSLPHELFTLRPHKVNVGAVQPSKAIKKPLADRYLVRHRAIAHPRLPLITPRLLCLVVTRLGSSLFGPRTRGLGSAELVVSADGIEPVQCESHSGPMQDNTNDCPIAVAKVYRCVTTTAPRVCNDQEGMRQTGHPHSSMFKSKQDVYKSGVPSLLKYSHTQYMVYTLP